MKPELSQYSFRELMVELKSQLPVSEMVLQHPMWNCGAQYFVKFAPYHQTWNVRCYDA